MTSGSAYRQCLDLNRVRRMGFGMVDYSLSGNCSFVAHGGRDLAMAPSGCNGEVDAGRVQEMGPKSFHEHACDVLGRACLG